MQGYNYHVPTSKLIQNKYATTEKVAHVNIRDVDVLKISHDQKVNRTIN